MKLQSGDEVKGFLLSCEQNRQKQAVKDAYNFLGQFIDKLYPDIKPTGPHKKRNTGNPQSLESELANLKKKENRMLFSLETDVKCLIFVKVNPVFQQIDPAKVVYTIMEEMKEDRQLTRYCYRVLPVEKAFKAEFFHMRNAVTQLMTRLTKQGEKRSWAMHFKCRNNTKFKYKEVMKEVTSIAAGLGHFTQIYYPQMMVCIEICNHLMCVSVLEKFKEYNEFKLKKTHCVPLDPPKQEQCLEKQQLEDSVEIGPDGELREAIPGKKKLVESKIDIGDDDIQFV